MYEVTKRKVGRPRKKPRAYQSYKVHLNPKSHYWIQMLNKKYGASPASTIDIALQMYIEIFSLKDVPPDNAKVQYLLNNVGALSEEIIERISRENMTTGDMKRFLIEIIFRFITSNVWKKSEIDTRYKLSQRIQLLPANNQSTP